MIDFREARGVNFGGCVDTLALLWAIAAGFVTLPILYGPTHFALAGGALIAAIGGTRFGWQMGAKLRLTHGGAFELNSHDPPPVEPGDIRLGFVSHTMQELAVSPDAWTRHAMIVGKSGVGKTVIGSWLMIQQIAAGGGLLWIDGKLDPDNIEMLHQMCCWAGRGDDLLVVNPGSPSMSNTYNPLVDGGADEVASRLGALLPEASANAAADYYRASAINAIASLVSATRAAGWAITFEDLRVLLTRLAALEWLLADLRKKGKEADAVQFSLFLDQLRKRDSKTGADVLDQDGLRRMFGGLGARLAQFGGGEFGEVMNSYAPEGRLKDAIRRGKVVYFALPTMGKGEAATALGKMAIGDFRSAIAAVQDLPKHERPQRPFLGFFDEAGSYVTQAWSRMFEQARSARLVMCPAFQTKANLETLGEELRAMVAGNTDTKIFFQPGEPDTAQWCADMIGKEMQEVHTHSESAGSHARGVTVLDRGRGGSNSASASRGEAHSVTRREDYIVPASDLVKLDRGECVVSLKGHGTYHVRVPLVTFDDDFVARVGSFQPGHSPAETPEGLEPLRIMQRAAAMR
jgi:hypothetical protein